MTRKWNFVSDNLKANCVVRNKITYNTEVLKSNLCDYNDAYIFVRGDNIVIAAGETQVAFKSCAPFTKCILKIDGITTDDAADLDLVMQMYNLIEYSSNYSETTGSLSFNSEDEATNFNAVIESTELLGNTEGDNTNGILKNTTISLPLKYLSNFWRLLEMPLIDCRVELKFKWTKYCVLSGSNINEDANVNNIIFIIKDTKSYIPVVTSSAKDNQKLSKLLSNGFERSVYWN